MFSPIIESVANENEDVKVVKINVDNAQDLAIKYQVNAIPYFVVFKNGEFKESVVGMRSESELLSILSKYM